ALCSTRRSRSTSSSRARGPHSAGASVLHTRTCEATWPATRAKKCAFPRLFGRLPHLFTRLPMATNYQREAALTTWKEEVQGMDTLLTVEQAAQRLGVSFWTVYRLARSGQLASIRLGRRRLIAERDLEDLVGRTRGETSGAGSSSKAKRDN